MNGSLTSSDPTRQCDVIFMSDRPFTTAPVRHEGPVRQFNFEKFFWILKPFSNVPLRDTAVDIVVSQPFRNLKSPIILLPSNHFRPRLQPQRRIFGSVEVSLQTCIRIFFHYLLIGTTEKITPRRRFCILCSQTPTDDDTT